MRQDFFNWPFWPVSCFYSVPPTSLLMVWLSYILPISSTWLNAIRAEVLFIPSVFPTQRMTWHIGLSMKTPVADGRPSLGRHTRTNSYLVRGRSVVSSVERKGWHIRIVKICLLLKWLESGLKIRTWTSAVYVGGSDGRCWRPVLMQKLKDKNRERRARSLLLGEQRNSQGRMSQALD